MFMDLLRVVLLCTRFVSSAWNWILKSKNFLGIFVDYRYLYYLSYAILLPWKLAKSTLGLQGVSSIDLGALEFRVSWDSWFWISSNIFQLLGQIIGPRQCLHPTWTFINGTFGIVFSFVECFCSQNGCYVVHTCHRLQYVMWILVFLLFQGMCL